MHAHSRVVSVGDVKIRIWEWGERHSSTILFVHGFLDFGLGWEAVIPFLSDFPGRFIAMDLRGHGDSDWHPRGVAYHLIDFIRDVSETVKATGATRVHLVG